MKLSFTSAIVSTVLVVAGLVDLGSAQSRFATCRCGGATANTYNATQLTTAVTTGRAAAPRTIGVYPHVFNNFEAIAFPTCLRQTLNEFPVLGSGVYSGGSSGVDRVIYTSSGFCGCITHTGAPTRNGFVPCVYVV